MIRKYYKLFLFYLLLSGVIVFGLLSFGNCSFNWFDSLMKFENSIDITSFVVLLIFVILLAIGFTGKRIIKDNKKKGN